MKTRLTAILLMTAAVLFAAPVEKETAVKTAVNWLTSADPSGDYSPEPDVSLISDAVYVIDFPEGGFALIAADDASVPVLGYSSSGRFGSSIERPNVGYWMNMYVRAVEEIREKGLTNVETYPLWKNILENRMSASGSKAVGPLLTSTWNQSPLYNNYCPLDGGSLSVVGCVATAMAQIMNYYQYPEVGASSHSYTELGQLLSVDYYISRYNWDLMPSALTSGSSAEAIHEVAQISYHAGVAVEMMYGADGSGAYSEDVPYALETYFKYDTSAQHVYRSSYNATSWRNLLQSQIDSGKPVYYSGSGDGGGHAFVCDGYTDANYYHFNWGWGGYADGDYHIDNLNPGGSEFNDFQAAVINIIPKTQEITLTAPIPDVQTAESSYQIDLDNYFTGSDITYRIDAKSELNGLQYDITGSILTLNKLEDGVSKIVVTGSTRYDNNFDEFYFKFGSGSLLTAFGNAYRFDGVAYMDAGVSELLNSMDVMTFSTWVKLNTNNVEHGIASKSTSTNTGWNIIVQNNNLLKFSVKTQDGITRRIYGLTPLQPGIWYHLDFVYNGKDLAIYINGDLDNIKTSYTAVSAISHDATASVKIGFSNGLYLDGTIDETVLWKTAAGLASVRSMMNSRTDVSNEDLVSYWPYSEGFYDYTLDAAGLHDGTLVSGDLSYWTSSEAPLYFFAEKNGVLSGSLLGDEDASSVYSLVSEPSSGSFVIDDTSSGAFTYTPSADYSGKDTLTYNISYNGVPGPERTAVIDVREGNSIEDSGITAESFELLGNYPNPFNPETTVNFELNREMNITLSVFDSYGRCVADLFRGSRPSGRHSVRWNGKDHSGRSLASGIYYFRLSSEQGISKISKALMIK